MATRKFKIKQPRNRRYGQAELKFNTKFSKKWEDRFTEAQKYLDGAVYEDSEPFTPHQTGMLVHSGETGTDFGSGEVKWIAPYARFQYYGKVMIGKDSKSAWAKRGERKVVTGKDLTYHGGGQRGSFWFERAKAAHREKWVKGVQDKLDGK